MQLINLNSVQRHMMFLVIVSYCLQLQGYIHTCIINFYKLCGFLSLFIAGMHLYKVLKINNEENASVILYLLNTLTYINIHVFF